MKKLIRNLLLIPLLALLWMGAQINSSERRSALHSSIPLSFEPYVAPLIDYICDALDGTYVAIDQSKFAVFLWGKVLLLIGAPIVKLCMWNFSLIIYFFHLIFPYLVEFWHILVNIGVKCQPYFIILWNYILTGLKWSYPYMIQFKNFLLFYGEIITNYLWENINHLFHIFMQQDQLWILGELITPVILAGLWLLQRYIRKHYYQFSQKIIKYVQKRLKQVKLFVGGKYLEMKLYIKKKSLLAAAFLPHLLLVSPLVLGIYFLPTVLARISSGYILIFVSLIYPVFNTIYSLEKDSDSHKRQALVYWVVFSLIAAIHNLVGYIPFASTTVESIPYLQEFGFCFFLWLQLPWTDGSNILYETLIPLINSKLKAFTLPGFLVSFQNTLQNPYLAVFINAVVPDPYRSNVMAVLLQGGTLVSGLPFFFTADYFTGLATIFIGILVPYYASVSVLSQSQSSNTVEKNVFNWWLKYWIIFLCFSYFHDAFTTALNLSHFPYWYQLKLGIIYWLQLPLTAGANQMYDRIISPICKRIGLSKTDLKNTNDIATDDKIKQD